MQKNHQNKWSTTSWREYPIKQQPMYNDQGKFEETLKEISAMPPVIERMGAILHEGLQKPILQIGRMAGQYAKPRSSPYETINGAQVPSFKGDIINSLDLKGRNPDPARLHRGYTCSATTMNTIRGYLKNHPMIDKEDNSSGTTDTSSLTDCPPIDDENFFVSHEALLLAYEESFTTFCKAGDSRPYNLSGHFLWIGERTRQLNEAHVEYFRGIANPIGVKVGPTADPQHIVDLVNILNPDNEPGKIVLISRMGLKSVQEKLAPIVEKVKESGKTVLWVCDPMHGNTYATPSKIKTRDYASVVQEIKHVNEIFTNCGVNLGGIHLEVTWEDVTECIDENTDITADTLNVNYNTSCDPRLNGSQCENFTKAFVDYLTTLREASS
eukprot:CAMPEP_0115006248 /NCGR_PEP_ID=MMETSP0216-20121206/20381_1 /TAXON_ID=223996 /ORGANISM="Protocruzia adherens, Strain Boccale" /LENGTH=382 /DNA_ID=CAMNT_0002372783 /DNA_START=1 /DNA_END=1149 /DNA_ORIENTATION=-